MPRCCECGRTRRTQPLNYYMGMMGFNPAMYQSEQFCGECCRKALRHAQGWPVLDLSKPTGPREAESSSKLLMGIKTDT